MSNLCIQLTWIPKLGSFEALATILSKSTQFIIAFFLLTISKFFIKKLLSEIKLLKGKQHKTFLKTTLFYPLIPQSSHPFFKISNNHLIPETFISNNFKKISLHFIIFFLFIILFYFFLSYTKKSFIWLFYLFFHFFWWKERLTFFKVACHTVCSTFTRIFCIFFSYRSFFLILILSHVLYKIKSKKCL